MQTNTKISLSIDIGTQIKVEIVGFEGNFKCNLIGIKPNEYIIIDAPPANISKQLQEGTTAIIRYLYFGNVFGFKSKTLRLISKPFDLLLLSYPESIESHNLRKNTRIQCHIPAAALFQNREVRGVIVDISVSGCQFVVNTAKLNLSNSLKIEEAIKLVFPFFGKEKLNTVHAAILHINSDDGNVFLGLRFEKLDPELLKAIENYIEDVSDQTP